jgi:hypothetical protein
MMEYDPAPPLDAGTPQAAGAALVGQAMSLMTAAMAGGTGAPSERSREKELIVDGRRGGPPSCA